MSLEEHERPPLTALPAPFIQGAFSSHAPEPSILISTILQDPDIQIDSIAYVERQVELVLDELVLRGALQKVNQMDIGSLLNSAGESHVLTDASDADIYQAVTEAFEACENLEINGGDNVDEDGPVKPRQPNLMFFRLL